MKMRETSRAEDKKLQVNNDSEYQIERLHQIGDQNPASGLKNKVKGWQFSNKIDVPDTVTKEMHSEPMKQFMVNQLAIMLERDRLILSPYDNVLYKQLIDYSVERISQNGIPVYTSKDEHFIDATGLCVLAMVLEFPLITQTVKRIENTTNMVHISANFGAQKAQMDIWAMANNAQQKNPWEGRKDMDDLPGDRPTYFKIPIGKKTVQNSVSAIGWGSRMATRSNGNPRTMW